MEIVRRLWAFFMDIVEVVVFAVAIFLFLYLLVIQPHKIKGTSMDPNFPNGEFLLTDKITYRFSEPKRGDVIVFKPPLETDDEYIKRIIGLPGETVAIENNHVVVNGSPLDEKYIAGSVPTSGGYFLNEGGRITVPADEYFVLGDNRPSSSDSRTWGMVTKNLIKGRAWLIYWPPQKTGFIKNPSY